MAGTPKPAQILRRAAQVLVAVIIAATGLAGTAAPASAAGSWSIGASVNPLAPPTGGWQTVACPTASVCLAVGSADTFDMIAQRWNGSAWSRVPIANPPLGQTYLPTFTGMACSSASSCFAVGRNGSPPRVPLMERWNGTSWSIATAPKPASATVAWLTDVACPRATFCLATGHYDNSGTALPYSARWNGTAWSIVTMARPTGSQSVHINGLSCVGPSNCFAVGGYTPTSGADKTLTERWNGTAWSITPSPTPAGVQTSHLDDVSCTSNTFCFATGYYTSNGTYRPFGSRWNGSSWSLVNLAVPPGHPRSFLSSVSCTSSTFCFGAGATYTSTGTGKPWTQRYNGTTWTPIASPGYGGNGYFAAATCTSPTACFAVGSDEAVGNEFGIATLGLIDRWDGSSWKISPAPPNGSQSGLRNISCVSTSFCMAVGASANGASTALVERWNGAHWSVSKAPVPAAATGSLLRGVSCTSTTNCFAVGRWNTDDQGYNSKPLIERWNGTGWAIIPSPEVGANEAVLSSVSCPIASRCFAVGTTSQSLTIVEHWDGASWKINATGTNDLGYLSSVSCATDTRCFAVGTTFDFSSTFARRWNGTTWSTVPTPNLGDSALAGVSCTAASACTAVGFSRPSGSQQPLIERWNGSAWSISASPDPSGAFDQLLGVSCASGTSCVAVGVTNSHPLIEEWHGSAWTVAASPDPIGSSFNYLFGVDALNSTKYIAVGRSHTRTYADTLVEQNF